MEQVETATPGRDERTRPVRLLVVAHSLEHGGAEHSLLLLLERLDRTAFDCLLAAPEGPMRERFLVCCRPAVLLRRGYLPLTCQILSYARAFYATVVNTMRLRRYMTHHPVDLVLTNTGVALHGPLAAALSGVPGVTLMREIVSPPIVRAALIRLLLRLNRRVIANSRAAVPAAGGLAADKMIVVHGGVELDGARPTPAAAGAMPAFPARGPLIGMIGTVHPIKGHEAFLRMAALAAPRLPEASFVIVGSYEGNPRYYRTLLRLRRQLGLDQRAVFTGFVERMEPVFDRLSAVVMTSSTESLPRVALEAMAAARPVVAFDVGGVSELVQDGVTGRLIRDGDLEAMADAVCRLAESPSEAARLGEGGRARVRQSFQLGPSMARIEAVLREVVAEGVVDEAAGRTARARGGTV